MMLARIRLPYINTWRRLKGYSPNWQSHYIKSLGTQALIAECGASLRKEDTEKPSWPYYKCIRCQVALALAGWKEV